MKAKFLVIVLILLLLLTMPISVYADEQENTATIEEFDFEHFANQFKQISSDDFYAALNSVETDAFSKLEWEVPSGVESKALLDLQYSNLVADFALKGFGQSAELQVPEFETGYSGSITDRFTETFGDLSEKQLPEVSLPEGWDMKSIMSSAKEQRDALAAEFTNSEEYKTVVNSISISSLFGDAKHTLETPELMSAYSLRQRVAIQSLPGQFESSIQGMKDFAEIEKAAAKADASLDVKTIADMQAMFESESVKSKADINKLAAAEEKAELEDMLDNVQDAMNEYKEEKKEEEKEQIAESIENLTNGTISAEDVEPSNDVGYALEFIDEIGDAIFHEDELTDEVSDALRNSLVNTISDMLSD